jgi:hypothetical protein
MNRQDLAMKIYVKGDHNPESAFADADAFIEECERQRKQPEPPKVLRHAWPGGGEPCVNCGSYSDEDPEQRCYPKPAPKREAREFLVRVDVPDNKYDIKPWYGQGTIPPRYFVCREVLND